MGRSEKPGECCRCPGGTVKEPGDEVKQVVKDGGWGWLETGDGPARVWPEWEAESE